MLKGHEIVPGLCFALLNSLFVFVAVSLFKKLLRSEYFSSLSLIVDYSLLYYSADLKFYPDHSFNDT